MKRIILSIITILICGISLTTYASHTILKNTANSINIKKEGNMDFELLPTMETKSNAKNQAWVGTFQLVWNDLIDKLIKQPVEFVDYKSTMAEELNKKSFGVNEISENAYYKKWGLVSQQLKTEIEQGIKTKFDEKSDILDSLDWIPADKKYLLYAMLKKDFEFIETLKNLGKSEFNGSEGEVEYFGIDYDATSEQRDSVKVLFYTGKNDFAVQLKSKQGDVISLYRTDDEKSLYEYYNDMNKKTGKNLGSVNDEDRFKAPLLDFTQIGTFDELCGHQIKGTDMMIGQAIETIKFKMNEAGVKLKSEAAIVTEFGCMPNFRPDPRYFYFDDKYVIFISEEGKKPYFALKVSDAAKLQG